MRHIPSIGATALLALTALVPAGPAEAACNAYVNGRPMTAQECRVGLQVYGSVLPGTYSLNARGDWYHHQTGRWGNTYRDAQRRASGGSRGGSHRTMHGGAVISLDGCSGSDCVVFTD